MGDVPICLIVDGAFSTASLERTYGVQSIYPHDVPDERLQKYSYGWGLTKMIAFWHSPFERFLFLDSDTIVWGDVLTLARTVKDVLIDRFHSGHTDADINGFFFNIERFERQFPQTDWRRHQADYFCSGVFAARRNALSLDEYLSYLKLQRDQPALFKPGEQTLLNLMIFQAGDEGRIDVMCEDIQYVTSGIPEKDLREKFPIVEGKPDVSQGSVVIHWTSRKPLMDRSKFYPTPMTFFRRKFLWDAYRLSGFRADLVLKVEDLVYHALVYKNRLRRLIAKISRTLPFPGNRLPVGDP